MSNTVAKSTTAEKPASQAGSDAVKPQSPWRKRAMMVVAAIALLIALKYLLQYIFVGRFMVSTDDAYVKADTSILSNKVAALVVATPVDNNTAVKAGDLLIKLDGSDYQSAFDGGKAKITTQQATLAGIAAQKKSQQAQITSAHAQLDSATAAQNVASLVQQRAAQLLKAGAGTQQELDDANKSLAAAKAAVIAAQSAIDSATSQLANLDAAEAQGQSALNELQIALAKAQGDLASTEIKAPFDGVVSNRAVARGEFVPPGTNLIALVPVQSSFVTANFKETQLPFVHPGQKAEIEVDSLKGETFEGKVASLSPSSGAEFSLLPPDNATGNFTKIIQRFPVKVILPREVSLRLRPGMSVVVSVDSRDKGDEQKADDKAK